MIDDDHDEYEWFRMNPKMRFKIDPKIVMAEEDVDFFEKKSGFVMNVMNVIFLNWLI